MDEFALQKTWDAELIKEAEKRGTKTFARFDTNPRESQASEEEETRKKETESVHDLVSEEQAQVYRLATDAGGIQKMEEETRRRITERRNKLEEEIRKTSEKLTIDPYNDGLIIKLQALEETLMEIEDGFQIQKDY